VAYSETVKLVKGDTLPELTITLKDSNTAASGQSLDPENPSTFAPIDVTGGTVRVRVREIGETTILKTITTSITDASAGKVAMLFPTDTFPSAGIYEAEVEFTKSDGNIQTVNDLIKLSVRDDFD
tara:strand:- start:5985 stop:6359 length:375 start_codon:yes stop_codon:yes gene_type:complete